MLSIRRKKDYTVSLRGLKKEVNIRSKSPETALLQALSILKKDKDIVWGEYIYAKSSKDVANATVTNANSTDYFWLRNKDIGKILW